MRERHRAELEQMENQIVGTPRVSARPCDVNGLATLSSTATARAEAGVLLVNLVSARHCLCSAAQNLLGARVTPACFHVAATRSGDSSWPGLKGSTLGSNVRQGDFRHFRVLCSSIGHYFRGSHG